MRKVLGFVFDGASFLAFSGAWFLVASWLAGVSDDLLVAWLLCGTGLVLWLMGAALLKEGWR